MKLIEFKNNELVISDEAYTVKYFRELYNRDSEYAMALFGFMYFFNHPGSDYNYITDADEKIEVITKALGLEDKGFLNDPLFIQCSDIYCKMVVTISSKLLDNNRKRLDKLDVFLDNLVLDEDNVTKFTKTISDATKLAVEISQAEKDIHKEVEEQTTKVRGRTELTIGDRGLD